MHRPHLPCTTFHKSSPAIHASACLQAVVIVLSEKQAGHDQCLSPVSVESDTCIGAERMGKELDFPAAAYWMRVLAFDSLPKGSNNGALPQHLRLLEYAKNKPLNLVSLMGQYGAPGEPIQ